MDLYGSIYGLGMIRDDCGSGILFFGPKKGGISWVLLHFWLSLLAAPLVIARCITTMWAVHQPHFGEQCGEQIWKRYG